MKDKRIVIFILGVIVIILISLLILIKNLNDKAINLDDYEKVDVKEKVEVYSKVKVSDIIKDQKIDEDFEIDTKEIGLRKVEYESNGVKYSFYIEVDDLTSPYVMLGNSYTYVMGNDFNLEKSIFYGDNYSKELKTFLDGNYDLKKVGKYPLTFTVVDESGNKNEVKFTLNVIEKKENPKDSHLSFEEIKKVKTDDSSLMIDVSKWQEDIDWKKVHEQGIDYAMLRLGTQKGFGKESVLDSYFEKNIKEAKKNGVKVGVYYYSYAKSVEDAIEQADWVVENLKDYKLDLPVVFDWECFSYFKDLNLNFYELNEIADTFLKKVQENGYEVMMYGSKNYLENVWTFIEYPTWLAHYTKSTNYKKDYVMWQFTNKGRIDGIKGNVDFNLYYNK